MKDKIWGQEFIGQGCTTLKLDLEAWRRHHSRPLWSTSFSGRPHYTLSVCMYVCPSVLCPPLTRNRKTVQSSNFEERLSTRGAAGRAISRRKGQRSRSLYRVGHCEVWSVFATFSSWNVNKVCSIIIIIIIIIIITRTRTLRKGTLR